MDGRDVLKVITGMFIFVFVASVFGVVTHKSYAAPNPYVIKSAKVISANGDVEGQVIDIHNDEIINDFKLHGLNDSISLKVTFENTNSKKYIIKSISDDNENNCIEYKIEYLENQKIDPDGTFDVILTITYINEIDNLDERELETPIKLTIVCSDDEEELNDENLIETPVVRMSRNRREVVPDNYEEVLTSLEGEVKGEEIYNNVVKTNNPKTIDKINYYLISLLVSAFGSAVCLIMLTRNNKNALIKVVCVIFVVSSFIPIMVDAQDTAFNGLLLKNPGIFDKLIIKYTIDDEEKEEIVDYNSSLEIEVPEKEGYTFIGWLQDDKTFYDTNETVKADMNVVGIYKPNTYYVIFDKNSITATGQMTKQELTYDKNESLSKNTFTNTGYAFSGWNTRADGLGTVYYDLQDVKNIMTEGSITLYAQWRKIKTSTLVKGQTINAKMKQLAGTSNATYNTDDTNIKEIKRSNVLPIEYNKSTNIISLTTDTYPTYMWFDNGTIYYFSEADKIYLNKESSFLFNRLTEVKNIDTSFDTSNVTTMENMFYKCQKLNNLDLSTFNTNNVTNLKSMFSEAFSVTSLDFKSFNTSKVTNFSYMFNQCYGLTELDVSNFNTQNAINLSHMFSSAENIIKLDLSNFDTTKVKQMDCIFSNMFALTDLNIDSFDTSNVTTMLKMFLNAKSLKELDLTKFNTSKVTNMSQMFEGCISLEKVNLSTFNTSNVTTMSRMFAKCSELKELDISNFNTVKVTTMQEMFLECSKLTKLNLGNMVTTSLTNMADMFRTCSTLNSIDVSSFNTNNVTNMKGVFNGMNNLESVDVSNFNTSKVTNMQGMFSGLNKVKTIDVSNFDTANVTNMAWMFDKMFELTTIYVSNKFVTPKVTNGKQMFEFDEKLQGANGTKYDKKNMTYKYAVVDTPSTPGYFTLK